MHNTFLIVNIVLVVVCAVMALVFLFLPIQRKEGLKNYRISLRLFALAYLVLAVLTLVNLLSGGSELDLFINFTAISLQTILFALSLIVLINPYFVNLYYVLKRLLPTFLFVVVFICFTKIWNPLHFHHIADVIQHYNQPLSVLYLLFFAFCVLQLFYFFRVFISQTKKYESKLDNYYADTYPLQLRGVRYYFYGASVFCVMVMVSVLIPSPIFGLVVTAINSVFYIAFGLYYIQYPTIYHIIEPVIGISALNQNADQKVVARGLSWEKLKSTIVSDKYYLHSEINIEEMAQYLKIGRTTLSNFINKEENMSFHTWVNMLRIEEAKKLFSENNDMTITQVAEQIGYCEISHFSRQFKQITGYSPSIWRQALSKQF